MLVLATVPVATYMKRLKPINIFIESFWVGGGGMWKEYYCLYACENAENYGWSLSNSHDNACACGSYIAMNYVYRLSAVQWYRIAT